MTSKEEKEAAKASRVAAKAFKAAVADIKRDWDIIITLWTQTDLQEENWETKLPKMFKERKELFDHARTSVNCFIDKVKQKGRIIPTKFSERENILFDPKKLKYLNIINPKADGKCFYYCLSLALFGTDKYATELKIHVGDLIIWLE